MTSYCRRAVLAALFVTAPFVSAPAQQSTPGPIREVIEGTRVRVRAPSLRRDRYIGRVDSLEAGRMVLDTAAARTRLGFDTGPILVDQYRLVTIPLTAVETIEVTGGRDARRSTFKYAIFGALVGALATGLGGLPEVNPGFSDFVDGLPVGAVIGSVAGGIVGFALGGERWLPARIPR